VQASRSCDELADTAGGSDASLSDGGELLGANNAGNLGELALAEDLEEASLGNIDNSSRLLSRGFACLLGHEGPKLVNVHRGAVVLVSLIVEMSLSFLSVVAGVIFHHHDSVVVHATSVTTTTGVLSHAADSTVSHGHVTPHTSSLSQPCYHFSLPIDLIIMTSVTQNALYILLVKALIRSSFTLIIV